MAYTGNSRYDNRRTVSMGQWLFSFLILLIPVVNIIMLCVWSFGKKTPKTKENWAKACLLVLVLASLGVGIWLLIAQIDFTSLLRQA